MITLILFMIIFSIANIIKGGQLDDIFTNFDKVVYRHEWKRAIFSCKFLSAIWVWIGCGFMTFFIQENLGWTGNAWIDILLIAAMWWVSTMPDPKLTAFSAFNIPEGFKATIIRGSFIAVCMFIGTGSPYMMLCAPLYAIAAYIGMILVNRQIWKLHPRGVTEFIIGALAYGLPFALSTN